MKLVHLPILICSLIGIVLCGCTLEDETAEKLISKEQSVQTEPTKQEIFKTLCYNCYLGKADNFDEIVSLYYSTLSDKDTRFIKNNYDFLPDSDGSYLYQSEFLTREFEKCLQKAITTRSTHYSDFLITRAYICARISLSFYKEKDYLNASYWARRAVNIVGPGQGNYILGRVYIRDDKTIDVGAEYLAHSAHLGYSNAITALRDSISKHSVFELFLNKEE